MLRWITDLAASPPPSSVRCPYYRPSAIQSFHQTLSYYRPKCHPINRLLPSVITAHLESLPTLYWCQSCHTESVSKLTDFIPSSSPSLVHFAEWRSYKCPLVQSSNMSIRAQYRSLSSNIVIQHKSCHHQRVTPNQRSQLSPPPPPLLLYAYSAVWRPFYCYKSVSTG